MQRAREKNEPSFLHEQRVTHWKITVVGWLWSWIPLSEALKCYHYPNINELPSSSNISSLRTTVLVLQWDIALKLKIRSSMKTTKAEMNHFLACSVYRELTISWKVVFCLMRLWNVRVNETEWFRPYTRLIKTRVLPPCKCYWALNLEHFQNHLYSV